MSAPAFPVVISRDDILRRVHELARELTKLHADAPPVYIAGMDGARVFADCLRRVLPGQPAYLEGRAESYGDGTVSSDELAAVEDSRPKAKGGPGGRPRS